MIQLNSPLYTIGPGTSTEWNGNALDDTGCSWIVTAEAGWSSSPPARPSQADKTIGDGTFSGPGFYAGRLVTLTGTCVAPNQTAMLWAKEAIKAAFGPWDLVTLQVDELHLSRVAQVTLNDDVQIQDKTTVVFTWQMGLFAADPRRYLVTPTTLTAELPATAPGVGRSYPRSYPRTYAAGGTGAQVTFTQAGNYKLTPAVITIAGPVTSPTVEHDRSGSHITLDMTIPAGESVVLDLAAETALLGGSSVAEYMTSDSAWFLLERGANVVRFRGSPGAGSTPVMTMVASSAWV
ncbi:MAG TPA: hypothetical protein VGG54_22665 [Trebonia sp.]|jgi:hypothetical protein